MIFLVFDIATTKLGRRAFNKYHTILKPSTSSLSTAPHISLSPTAPFSPFLSLYFFLLINSILHLSFLTSFFLFPHISLFLSLSLSLKLVATWGPTRVRAVRQRSGKSRQRCGPCHNGLPNGCSGGWEEHAEVQALMWWHDRRADQRCK
jgi:hypothetical protein